MNRKKKNIDILLERNASEQLAKVDWDGLNTSISRGLDQARQGRTFRPRFSTAFNIAAGVAGAAAVVFFIMALQTDTPTGVRFEHSGSAVVELVGSKGSAEIDIKERPAESWVSVDIGSSHRELSKRDIEIIDVKQEQQKNGSLPAWIIIRMPEPAVADNGAGKDEIDFICLL
jgi:hypothetical protein